MAQEIVPSAGTDAVSRELAQISDVHRAEPARYWRDKGMQARRRQLIESQLNGSTQAPARTADAQRSARKLELQSMMREGRNGRYYRSPELQAEYRAIVEAELSGSKGAIARARDDSGNVITRNDTRANNQATTQTAPKVDGWRASPDQFRANAPELAAKWGPQTEARLKEAQDNIFAVVKAVAQNAGGAVAVEMENSFRVLPIDAQNAVIHEISLPAPPGIGAKQAKAKDVARFASTPEGRDCVARWGSRAPRNVAIVRTRIEHAMADMSAASKKDFVHWLDNISGQEAAAIYGLLVGDISTRR